MYTLPAGTGTAYYSASGPLLLNPATVDGQLATPAVRSRRTAMPDPSAPGRNAARCTTSPKTGRREEKHKARTSLDAAWRAHVAAQLDDTMRTMGALANSTYSSERC